MNVENVSKYAILMHSTTMRLHQGPDLLIKGDRCSTALQDELKNEEIRIDAGSLIQLSPSNTSGSKNISTVQILDYINHLPIYENLYECPQAILKPVNELLWPFVISIADPAQRIRMIQDVCHCNWLLSLNKYNIVSISGDVFNLPDANFGCIIRYIGPVEELYPVGYFFGLEILDSFNGSLFKQEILPFTQNYCKDSDPSLCIFVTADRISQTPKGEPKNFANASFLEKFISVIGPSRSILGSVASNNSANKSAKKPSAKFYDQVDFGSVNNNNSNNNNNNNNSNYNMERNKKDPLETLTLDSEEFQQSIENREKNIERRATNTVQTQTQPQCGILKNKQHKEQTKSSSMFSGYCSELADEFSSENIRSISNNSQDIDLKDLIGDKWPPSAGDAAAMLNNQTLHNSYTSGRGALANNTNTASKSKRNKSPNAKKTTDTVILNKTLQNAGYDPTEDACSRNGSNTGLGVGSLVEVNVPDSKDTLYGVIRWIGIPSGETNTLLGVELEKDYIEMPFAPTNGSINGVSMFKCPPGRGIFVSSDQCSIDRRFLGTEDGAVGNSICEPSDKLIMSNGFHDEEQQTFGHMECPIVQGAVAPIKCTTLNDLQELCGKFKGIQGHNNSCYLDVTLFSMFAFTSVFDAILYRPPEKDDISHYEEVQTVLREGIVNSLRKHMFVRADRVMKLRELLDKLSSVSGLTSEEKDPEEFLNCLLSQIMRAEPFLKLSSGQDAYYYQLFVEKDECLLFPSVQQLFEQSFYATDIKLKEVPSCLIIQMPRFGKNFKMYPRILPSQVLDVTDIIDDSPRQCTICGKLAEYECRDCFGSLQSGVGLESTAFCQKCLGTVHMHAKRINHKNRKLSVPKDFHVMANNMTVPRLYMELFAVVCIETSHYVAFVKAGSGPDAPWCFFNSMADRKGELNGYNIPEIIAVPDLPKWLSEDGARTVNETSSNDKMLPEHAKRLFCDAYMCMYQSTDVMMYR